MTINGLLECLAMGREVRVAVCLEVKNQLILPDEVVEVESFLLLLQCYEEGKIPVLVADQQSLVGMYGASFLHLCTYSLKSDGLAPKFVCT